MDFPWTTPRVTFERFMDFCLYDPQRGYYRTKKKIFGRAGDYYTSSYTHRLFAEILAAALAHYLGRLGESGPVDLVELGAGEGILARNILAWMEANCSPLYRRLNYTAVEIDRPDLPASIHGMVLSNEFFDALPVHRVRVRESALREIYVETRDGIREVEGEISDARILEYMRVGFERWEEGCEYEVNLRLLEMLEDLERRMKRGYVVTIDYGHDRESYQALPRAGGTLMCYYQHQALADPYAHIGQQDITAHVNFEVMREVGERLGWRNEPLKTQRQFLREWGLEERLLEEERKGLFDPAQWEERLQLKTLLLPGGVSDTMKVLVQALRIG